VARVAYGLFYRGPEPDSEVFIPIIIFVDSNTLMSFSDSAIAKFN